MGTQKGRSGETGSLKSHLESIDALPLVSMEAKSVRKGSQECSKSRNFTVLYGEKQIRKSVIFLVSPLPEVPRPTHFFFIIGAEEKIKSHLQVWIREIHQGFALFYQEFRLGWAVPIKIQPLFLMAPEYQDMIPSLQSAHTRKSISF